METVVGGVPVGLGFLCPMGQKIRYQIVAQAVVSNVPLKGWDGAGFGAGKQKGSQVMDEVLWSKEDSYTRRTNNLGGFEEDGYDQWATIVVRGVP